MGKGVGFYLWKLPDFSHAKFSLPEEVRFRDADAFEDDSSAALRRH